MKKTLLKGLMCAGALVMGIGAVNAQTNTAWSTTSYIGIGTTAPGYPLQISNGGIGVITPANVNDAGYLRLGKDGQNFWHIRHTGTATGMDNDFQIFGLINNAWTTGLGISKTTGAVYIGNLGTGAGVARTCTSASSSGQYLKLYVDGLIGAREVRVSTTSWCDYVFEPSYKLKPLSEVESFIKANKHLPEVPSEQQVTANGLEMGEMMKIHMKKIEELTLYMIELKKENEKLAAEVAGLKK